MRRYPNAVALLVPACVIRLQETGVWVSMPTVRRHIERAKVANEGMDDGEWIPAPCTVVSVHNWTASRGAHATSPLPRYRH